MVFVLDGHQLGRNSVVNKAAERPADRPGGWATEQTGGLPAARAKSDSAADLVERPAARAGLGGAADLFERPAARAGLDGAADLVERPAARAGLGGGTPGRLSLAVMFTSPLGWVFLVLLDQEVRTRWWLAGKKNVVCSFSTQDSTFSSPTWRNAFRLSGHFHIVFVFEHYFLPFLFVYHSLSCLKLGGIVCHIRLAAYLNSVCMRIPTNLSGGLHTVRFGRLAEGSRRRFS